MPKPARLSDLPHGAAAPMDLDEVVNSIVRKKLATGNINLFTPIPTGFTILDTNMGGGLHGGDLTLLGGVQNIGKTAAVLEIASNAALSKAIAIMVCFEHSTQTMWERLLIQQSYEGRDVKHTTSDDIRKGYIGVIDHRNKHEDEKNDYINQLISKLPNGKRAWARLAGIQNNIWLVTGDSLWTTIDVLEYYVKMASEFSERILLIVDYVQRVPVIDATRHLTSEEKTERVVQGLKSLALRKSDEGIVVPVLGVATADAEGLRGGRIHVENLSGSSNTQYEPDQAIIMNKDIDFDEDGNKIVRFGLEKNRRGPSDIEIRHKYIGSAYTFDKKGTLVSEDESWQKERKLLKEEIAALYRGPVPGGAKST